MIYKSQIIQGDARTALATLEDASIDCVITSPPYWGLRDYQVDGQIGLESTPEEYVDTMVKVFNEVSRVLKHSGTLWLNLGDSYSSGNRKSVVNDNLRVSLVNTVRPPEVEGLKPKDLCGIPWRVAFALQADGWYLRQEIIWSKPNPMPESVKDRCTKAHESIFLLAHPESKGKYYYDADAIREKSETQWNRTQFVTEKRVQRDIGKGFGNLNQGNSAHPDLERSDRNKRSVWNISLKPYSAAHFATFPPELPRTCILAGTSEKGVCPDCGKPWCRDVESSGGNWQERKARGAGRGTLSTGANTNHGIGMSHDLDPPTRITLGWQPQCDCGSDPVPPTVLDPFAGAGTTLMVANQLQRHAIGV
ncbi:MAG: hypothetical protein CME31_23110, partial [Gimesia sp.]|nr:hypothetical protein [Gimesia sp.]